MRFKNWAINTIQDKCLQMKHHRICIEFVVYTNKWFVSNMQPWYKSISHICLLQRTCCGWHKMKQIQNGICFILYAPAEFIQEWDIIQECVFENFIHTLLLLFATHETFRTQKILKKILFIKRKCSNCCFCKISSCITFHFYFHINVCFLVAFVFRLVKQERTVVVISLLICHESI